VRVLSNKEELSWRRCFQHFYAGVENSTIRQMNRIDVPEFYKEIRRAVIETHFRRDGEFCWIFEEKMAMGTLSPKKIYTKWIKQKFSATMVNRNNFWAQHLGVSDAFVAASWKWAKASYTWTAWLVIFILR
jgi:hypothetical protein